MVRSTSKRRALSSAIPLLPRISASDAHQICNRIRTLAFEARQAMDDSADMVARANRATQEDNPVSAMRRIAGAQADHRFGCDKLATLARAMRQLIEWAAADWRPSLDVEDTGLTVEEVRLLCDVFGRGEDA